MENLPERIPSGQSLSPEAMFQQVTDLKREMEWIRSQLSTLDPIAGYMARRGFRCKRLNPIEHLLLPCAHDRTGRDRFYECLKKYSFRLFLRDVIKSKERFGLKDLLKYCSEDTQLRMEDKILPMFADVLSVKPHLTAGDLEPMRLSGGDVFQWGDRLFVMNAEPDLVGNMGLCLQRFFSHRAR